MHLFYSNKVLEKSEPFIYSFKAATERDGGLYILPNIKENLFFREIFMKRASRVSQIPVSSSILLATKQFNI